MATACRPPSRAGSLVRSRILQRFGDSSLRSVPAFQTGGSRPLSFGPAVGREFVHARSFPASTGPPARPPLGRRRRSTLGALRELVRSEALRPDRAQEKVAKRLDRLQAALVDYDNSVLFRETGGPEPADGPGRKRDERRGKASTGDERTEDPTVADPGTRPPVPALKIPRGLYVYGNVGTGKTMLMDSFYENARVPGEGRKQRFHFHDFLSQIHATVHRLKQKDLEENGRSFSVDTSLSNNPIHKAGLQIASRLSLLCLDEFQVTDIADAVILSQLFSVLFRHGTVVVATSNRPPKDLYEGGLNRSYFLPFIDLLEHHCITYHIPSERDYRRILSNCSSFFIRLDSGTDGRIDTEKVDALVEELAAECVSKGGCRGAKTEPRSVELEVGFNRSLTIRQAYYGDDEGRLPPRMARLSFEELCDADLGAVDYRAIANAFEIVVLENLPAMDLEGHNRARRFITLIDELYEGECALVCSALDAEAPTDLFRACAQPLPTPHDGDSHGETDSDSERGAPLEPLGIDVAQEGGTPVGALASVRELSFAFERSSSRIFEMCSRSWWERVLDPSGANETGEPRLPS